MMTHLRFAPRVENTLFEMKNTAESIVSPQSEGRQEEMQSSVRKPSQHFMSETKVQRIVTTLPSATEIVCLLGLENKLVGITHECDYPASIRDKKVVMRSVFDSKGMQSKEIDDLVLKHVRSGKSIYVIDERTLQELKPDLIITQELCEVCATPLQVVAKSIARLKPKPNVLSLSPHNLEDILDNVLNVGRATGRFERACKIVASLSQRIEKIKSKCFDDPSVSRPSVFCLEWLDPLYCSGHWMPELVQNAGGREILGKMGEPSFVTEWERVVELDPEVIFVTVCGYKIERTLSEISRLTEGKGWSSLLAVKKGKVYILDSPSYYSRSGPRLVDGLEIMAAILHPDLFHGYIFPERAAYSLSQGQYLSAIPKDRIFE
jgi:iron complex transport system substrate-binding protein